MTASALTRGKVHSILLDWRSHEWQVQGFGMLRTYLDGPGEPRLQVWDQRVAAWSNNAVHDHPWRFESTIYAGVIFNQRYHAIPSPHGDGHVTQIIPGTRGGLLTDRPIEQVQLVADPVEVYALGDAYCQEHRELHLTRYLQGTVTLITRTERESADVANVAWFGAAHEQPPFVNPYPAPQSIAETVIEDALSTWWLR